MLVRFRGRRRRAALWLLISWLLPAAALAQQYSLETGVPLHVREFQGLTRVLEPVTFGVPLREEDQVTSVKSLYVTGPNGKAVPAQLRPTMRWFGTPDDPSKPIRWLLVDLQVSVPANGHVIYHLRSAPPESKSPKPKGPKIKPIKLKKSKKGKLRIKIKGMPPVKLNTGSGNPLENLWDGLGGKGQTSDAPDIGSNIQMPGQTGFYLKDRFGAVYSSNHHPVTFTVEESGPLRLVIRADGRHGPVDPAKGIGRDFFQYRTRYIFYAGKPYVRVVHTLRNAYLLDPLGSIGFEGYSLNIDLKASGLLQKPLARFPVQAGSPMVFNTPSRLYQDSDGGEWWSDTPGTSFKGYRVFNGTQLAHAGDQAPGYVHFGDGKVGLTLAMRWFHEQYPKAFEFDGTALKFHIFPEESASFHWLDDFQQITTDFMVYAHHGTGPTPDEAALTFLNPLRPYADPWWTRETKAWGDQGYLAIPKKTPQQMQDHAQSMLTSIYVDAYKKSNYAFGWSEFGEPVWCKNTHTSGSPRNLLTYFDRFAMNGSYPEFRYRELFAIHSRDLRTYHVDGFTCEQFPDVVLWEGVPSLKSKGKLNRDKLDPALDPHREGIPTHGHGWNGFDIEHMVVDDLFEYYLLTGDPVSLDSLKEIGEAMRTWTSVYQSDKAPGSTRSVGWALRAHVKVWQVTGNAKVLDCAHKMVTSVKNTYGQTPSPITGLVYHYITRYPPAGDHMPDAEFDCPWQLAVAIYGMLLVHRETGNPDALEIAIDVADYLVDYCWSAGTMKESLNVDDHNHFKPKYDNTGVNTWIPSALVLTWTRHPRPEYLTVAGAMYNSWPTSFKDPTSYMGTGMVHWLHPLLSVMQGY